MKVNTMRFHITSVCGFLQMKNVKIYLTIIILFVSINVIYCNENNLAEFYLPIDMNSTWGNDDSTYVVIVPTNEKNEESENKILESAKRIFNHYEIITDTNAIKQDLSSKNIIVYGTHTGNLWLSKYFKELPIEVKPDKIIADKEYQGNELRLITVWMNPFNSDKSLCIYTAQQDKDISGINSVLHGYSQYLIASGKKVLKASYYTNQNGVWEFSDMPDFNFPEISKKEMYKDYDSFVKIFTDIFPMTEVNKEIYGINLPQLLNENRKKIEKFNTTIEFVDLLKKTITSCRGSHFWLDCSGKREYYDGFVEDDSYIISNHYQKYFQLNSKYLILYIPLFYFEGDYYFKSDVSLRDIEISKGSKLSKLCNKAPDELLESATDFERHFSWDYTLKKNISVNFPYFLNPDSVEVISLEIENPKGENISFSMNKNESFSITYSQRDESYKTLYLEKDKILYIKLPEMDIDLIEKFQKDLLLYRDNPISAVVVDIRNNKGGSDSVWRELLSMIIEKPMKMTNKVGLIDSETNKSYIKHHELGEELSEADIEEVDFLNHKKFLMFSSVDTISVNKSSLKFEGNIYVLSDKIYSSAGSFMNICKQFDNLISVGRQNTNILGIGIDPYCFSLPFSKAIFTIEPIADFTNVKNAGEMHHINVESQINPSLDDLVNYHNYEDNIKIEDFLYKHDPFFQKVLMIIKNE